MEIKQVKDVLRRWARVAEFCAARNEEVRQYHALMVATGGVRTQNLDCMPRSTDVHNETLNTVMHLMEMESEYAELVKRIQQEVRDETAFKLYVDGIVNRLPAIQREIIYCRYKRRMSVIKTGFVVGYAKSQVSHIEHEALYTLSKTLNIATTEGEN